MRKIFIVCFLSAIAITTLVWRAAAKPNRFGTFEDARKVQVSALIANPATFVGKTVEVEGTVSEQCKSMGCYFFFRSGKETLRVDLQDIAMTAPMREGRSARVQGQMVPYNGDYQLYASAVEFR